ncbi:T6SS immunity protein Tdi1 domain-containing protein [Methylosoma difficile]
MELIAEIKKAWGWVGLKPALVVGENDFGNFIIEDEVGRYWRICPEDLYCKLIAEDRAELVVLSNNQEFLHDWYMVSLVAEAKDKFGPLRPGYKYCLKIPGVLGGEYGGGNLGVISVAELVSASGHIAKEIEGLPDGAQVQLTITE